MKAEKEITIWGKGNEIRDFLYISDLIKFVELLIKKQKKNYEVYNCGSEIGVKILDLAKLIIKIAGKKIKIKKNLKAPTIDFNLVLDCGKAKKEIGWKAQVNLSDGIKKTLVWYKTNTFL
jgi:nucleoside-diphosphate-sugar epimerase